MKSRFDILGLGCTAVDDLLYVEQYPPADTKRRIAKRERQCGGLTATALVTAARMGARCAFAGVMGEDPESQFVLKTLRQEGIHLRHVVRRAGARPVLATVVVDLQRGTRTIFYDAEGVVGADARSPAEEVIQSARVLLVDRFGLPGMIRAAHVARAAGRPVVGDFEAADTPGLRKLVPLVDHLIVSEEFALRFARVTTPGKAVAKLQAWGHEVVAVTCGERGCYYRDQTDRLTQYHPAFKVRAENTTGCGDVFHGAYAHALAKDMALPDRIRFASAAAALKAARPGGQAAIPKSCEVEAFLSRSTLGGLSGAVETEGMGGVAQF